MVRSPCLSLSHRFVVRPFRCVLTLRSVLSPDCVQTGVASRSRLPVFHDENRPPTPSHAASSSASCSSSSSSSGAAAPPQQLQSFFKQRVSIHAPHGSSLWPASQSLKASAPSRKAARIALSDLPNASSNALLPHPIDAAGKRADVRQRAEAILRDARAAAAPSGPGTARIAGTGAALPTSRSFTGGTGRGGVGGVALLSSASFSVHSDTGCGADQGGVKRKAEEDDDDGDEFGEGGAEDDCDDVAIHADPDAKDVDMNRARTQAPRPPPSISVDSFLSSSSSSSSSSSPVHAHMMSISPSSAASSVGPSAVSLALSAFCHSNASRPVEAHLVISDYQPSILRHLLQSQHAHAPSPCYLSALQPDLNARMREILIDWMHDVSGKFRLQQETLFLAIHVMDRFLSRVAVTRRRLQLVGCVALLLACKYEEMLVPEVAAQHSNSAQQRRGACSRRSHRRVLTRMCVYVRTVAAAAATTAVGDVRWRTSCTSAIGRTRRRR